MNRFGVSGILGKYQNIGRLTKDPEMQYTAKGNARTNITVVTNRSRKNQMGEWEDIPTFWRVTLWGNQAERANALLAKGDLVFMEGYPEADAWIDKNSGEARAGLNLAFATVYGFGPAKTTGDREFNQEQEERQQKLREEEAALDADLDGNDI